MSINDDMERLTVAAQNTILHWSDLGVRGHLKEHPDFVEHSLTLIEEAVARVRAAIKEERPDCGHVADGEPERDFDDQVADYRAHSCDCDYCYQQESAPIPEHIDELFTPPTEGRELAPCATCGRPQWNAAGDPRCHDCRKARNQ